MTRDIEDYDPPASDIAELWIEDGQSPSWGDMAMKVAQALDEDSEFSERFVRSVTRCNPELIVKLLPTKEEDRLVEVLREKEAERRQDAIFEQKGYALT